MADIEELIIQGTDLDGQTIDWIGIAEVDDYLEFLDTWRWRYSNVSSN